MYSQLSRAEVELEALVRSKEQRVSSERRGLAGFLATMFLQRSGLRPLLVITAMFALQQFSGLYVTLFFAVSLFMVGIRGGAGRERRLEREIEADCIIHPSKFINVLRGVQQGFWVASGNNLVCVRSLNT